MEESSEGHSEGNKSAPESNRKRIIKSRAQIEALEKFYEEHKYPVESLKAEFARSTGLTEKQVSGWLCHRRLKDKRLLLNEKKHANGKQDRSSGIIPDRGSGLKQDSCGSTKQGGGDRNFDAREVESKITTSQKYASADDKFGFGGHFTGEAGRVDDSDDSDTTSGSSSSQPNVTLRVERDPLITASSRSQMGQRARSGPSGYLKVKGQVENAAITAVKRQMGSNYRADGPPLAVAFDPLPTGAFDETPERETQTDNEEPSPPRLSNASISYKNHYHAMGIGHNSKTSSHKSSFDARRIQMESLSDDSESEPYFQPRLKCKSPLLSNEDESFSRKSLVTDMHEGSMIDAPVYESRDRYPHHERGVKHSVGGRMKLDSRSGHHHSSPYNVRVSNVQPETEVYNYNGAHNKVLHKEDFESRQQKGASKRIRKEVKLFGERIAADDDFGSAQNKVLYKDEITVAKRVNIGPHQPHDGPSWTTPANRFPRSAEKSTSFSEEDDESAETSSYTD